jgi:hypothetical protein
MAEYLILIYDDESAWQNVSEADAGRIMEAHRTFAEANAAVLRGGHALQPTPSATSVRGSGPSATVTDGAFAETKEALGGYYLVDVDDLDQAIAVARQIPTLGGGLEVRPVMVFD